MLILVLIFIILFSISIAALSISSSQEEELLTQGWNNLSNKTRAEVQVWGNCCGFKDSPKYAHPPCENLKVRNLSKDPQKKVGSQANSIMEC